MWGGQSHPDRSDRFFGRTSVGTGHTGGRKSVGGSGSSTNPFSHLFGNDATDGPFTGQRLRIDAQYSGFHFVGIGNDSASEIGGGSGMGRKAMGDVAPGARFGGGDTFVMLQKQRSGRFFQGSLSVPDDIVRDQGFETGELGVDFSGRLRVVGFVNRQPQPDPQGAGQVGQMQMGR